MVRCIPFVLGAIFAIGCGVRLPPATGTPSTRPAAEITPAWKYRVVTEVSGAKSYIFEDDAKPPLTLASSGAIADFQKVNQVLRLLELPPVSRNVPNQEDITGLRGDRGAYVWNDYPLGVLRIKRTLARGSFGGHYDAIWKVTIESHPDKK